MMASFLRGPLRRACHTQRVKASCRAPVPSRRRLSDVAVQDAVTTGEDLEPPWLALRVEAPSVAATKAMERVKARGSQFKAGEALEKPQKLLVASVEEVLSQALALAYAGRASSKWPVVAEHLLSLELTAEQAFLVFHCLVQMGDFEPKVLRKLLEKVVDRIECQYFSMELELNFHGLGGRLEGILRAFEMDEKNSFQSLVNHLPLKHKVQVMLLHSGRPQRGVKASSSVAPQIEEKDVKRSQRAWKTVDPVEMEEWERERYFKGRIRVLRMPNVEAKVLRTSPGKRLKAILASQLFQVLPSADAATLAEISQLCFFPQRLLTGDLQLDFQETLAKRIASLERHALLPYVLCFAAALRSCEGPEAYRTLRKRLLPDLLWLMRARKRAEILQNQRFVLPLLQLRGREGVQYELAEHCARLLISICGARQVQMDMEMLDALSSPLEEVLADSLLSGDADEDARGESILSTETLADLLSVLVTCKVQPRQELMELLHQLVLKGGTELWTIGGDVSEKSDEGPSNFGALCVTAHALSLLHSSPQASLKVLWTAAWPRLQKESTDVASCVMLLDALLRGAEEELLMTTELRSAMDEFVVQQVDMDLSALGHIGV